jgi:acyl carrier protein
MVAVRSVDVASAPDLDALLKDIDSLDAPLAGVVHAAGIVDDGSLVLQTEARARGVFLPKVHGFALLLDRLNNRGLDFIIAYSSIAGVIGSAGQATYAAANAVLDSLCEAARSSGTAATSVQWGAWADRGMSASLAPTDRARAEERGLLPMTGGEALDNLIDGIRLGVPAFVVAAIDWSRHARSTRPVPHGPFYDEVHVRRSPAAVISATEAVVSSIRQELERAPQAQRRDLLTDHVRALTLQCLGLDLSVQVDELRPLKELGVDSLLAVELRNALARSLGIALPATLAFDYPTTSAIAGRLLTQLVAADEVSPGATDPRATARADVSSLSDEEAEALLLKELDGL